MAAAIRTVHLVGGRDESAAMAGAVESAASGFETRIESDVAGVREAIQEGGVDCVVLEAGPRQRLDGSLLDRLDEVAETLPVIVVSSRAEAARAALAAGADDCVRTDAWEKPATILGRRIETVVGRPGTGRAATGPEEDPATVSNEADLERVESIIDGVGDILYALDAGGEYTYLNPAASRITGYSAAELLEHGPELIFDGADLAAFERAIDDLLRDEDREASRVEATIETKDGAAVPIETTLTVRYDAAGSFAGSLGVARDMTERITRERELERYARLIEASGDAVYALDSEGHFTFSNDAHQEIVDRPESELLGAHASIALPESAVQAGGELIRELLQSDRQQGTFEMAVRQPDGTHIPTENHLALLTDEAGEFRGTVGVLRDISERREREEELRRQNARLEQFAEIASHDLRNPLNVAQGYLEMLREDTDTEHAERVAEALYRMERLIDDTLTMARQGESVDEQTAVDLGAIVPGCWNAVGSEAGHLDVVDDVTIMADEARLRQVLENLLRNAIEHGGEGVSVRIGAVGDEGFYVEDDGPGIDPGQREAVFKAGHTTAATGTGFGLAIVSEIVDAHGWSIAVSESEGGGARFEITGVEVAG